MGYQLQRWSPGDDPAALFKTNSARIRAALLELLKAKKGGHVGGSLSIVELLSVLYTKQLRYNPELPQDPGRDYVVLSKGHAGPGLYAALAVAGFFPFDWLPTMNEGGTLLPSHPDRTKAPGVDATTGSLGQGTSIAAGLGYGMRLRKSDQYVYLIVGDGELNEGQCWEAFQFIAHQRLNRVIVLIDENKRQLDGYTQDVLNPFDLLEKVRAFGFHAVRVNGADELSIDAAIDAAKSVSDRAVCIVLDTVKGQGVPYFEQMASNHSVRFKAGDLEETERFLGGLKQKYNLEESACGA